MGLTQTTVGAKGPLQQDTELDSHSNLHKDIIFGFGLTNNVQLLNAKRERSHDVGDGEENAMETRFQQRLALTTVLRHTNLLCTDALNAATTRHDGKAWF